MAPPTTRADAFWSTPVEDLLTGLGLPPDPAVGLEAGLDETEAVRRLAADGPNSLHPSTRHRGLRLLVAQFESPIVLILVGATVLSMVLGDTTDGLIILAIILASGGLGFWQEHTAGRAIDTLLGKVRVEVDVRRGGATVTVPLESVVRGDVVRLSGGDLVPGDCRVVSSRELLVDESPLTGESFPVEKVAGELAASTELSARSNALYLGTHVVSGNATAVVVHTGVRTEFGAISQALGERDVTTGFERGVTRFGLLLVRAMVVLVSAIFVVNLVLDRPVVESFLFSVALAVGLTPQLLPAIVAISLATGARLMAEQRVIVRRLDAIEDFGAMTVLCTDKTGTLTAGAVHLDGALDVAGRPAPDVLRLALLNAGLQRGAPNPIDAAILVGGSPPAGTTLVDEVPYDFARRRLSVLVSSRGSAPELVTKGAVTEVLGTCDRAWADGSEVPLDRVRDQVGRRVEELSAQGFRVLAIASRPLPGATTVGVADERGLVLRGLLTFHDPPKDDVTDAISRLAGQGVSVRLVTGDNRLAAAQVARAVGLRTAGLVTGEEIEALDDEALAARCRDAEVFAEVAPLHKLRVVQALRSHGQVVGFLGDGINDVTALHGADVGISVDTAVDAAKQAASIVLLDKSLDVVSAGVTLGRQTFANTLKYIRVTTSANFGNMLSMAVASVFLPFLPLLPRQILLLNFLSDVPGMTIARDAVDPQQLESPRAWNLRSLRDFMIVFGLVSSAFDLATFAVLRLGLDAGPSLFRSAWFIESTLTELVAMLVLRTDRVFFRSRPGRGLLWSSLAVAVVTTALPFSPLADPLGLVAVPVRVLAALVGLIVLYVLANEAAKRLTHHLSR